MKAGSRSHRQFPPGESALFTPLSVEEFVRDHWPERVFSTHGPLQRLPGLAGCRALRGFEAFLDARPGNVRAWLTDAQRTFRQLRNVSSDHARTLLASRSGTIVADKVDTHLPPVAALQARLARRFGLPPSVPPGSNAYLTPAGMGNRMHFDEQEVVVVQLAGRKQWRHAPNRHVRYPRQGYMGEPILPPDLAPLVAELPQQMPDDATRVELRPGSVLFLPRGTWHETLALEDSLSITMTFPLPTWMDLLLVQLRVELLTSLDWRQPAWTGPAGAAGRKARREGWEQRLEQLRALIGTWTPATLMPRTRRRAARDPFPAWLARSPGVELGVVRRRRAGLQRTYVTLARRGQLEAEIEIEPVLEPLARWLAGRRAPFTPAAVDRAAGRLADRALVWELLDVLLGERALQARKS